MRTGNARQHAQHLMDAHLIHLIGHVLGKLLRCLEMYRYGFGFAVQEGLAQRLGVIRAGKFPIGDCQLFLGDLPAGMRGFTGKFVLVIQRQAAALHLHRALQFAQLSNRDARCLDTGMHFIIDFSKWS